MYVHAIIYPAITVALLTFVVVSSITEEEWHDVVGVPPVAVGQQEGLPAALTDSK